MGILGKPQGLLLAVLSSVLAPGAAPNSVLAQVAPGCTANSFSLPSWFIQDFQSTTSRASFQLLNRATNSSAEVTCQDPASGLDWRRCSTKRDTGSDKALDATVQLNGTIANIMINETWPCNDTATYKPLSFSAIGNNSLELNCTAKTWDCKAAASTPMLIKGTLLAPAHLTPVYALGPAGHDSAECLAASQSPAWGIFGTQYNHNTLVRPEGNVTSLTLSLQVTNNATGYTANCGGFFNTSATGPQRMGCYGQEPYRPREKYKIQTEAFYDLGSGMFTVNETWFCDGSNPAAPVSITGTGTINLPLECQVHLLEQDGFPQEVTFCSNDAESVPIAGHLVGQAALAPFVLRDPLATAESCTVSSIAAPAWRLYDFETVTDGGAPGSLAFAIELLTGAVPSEYPTLIAVEGVRLNDTGPVPCQFAPGDVQWGPSNCTLRYSSGTKLLNLEAEWSCNDLDKENPIAFTGVLNTTIPAMACLTEGTVTTCMSAKGRPWTSRITSVTWH